MPVTERQLAAYETDHAFQVLDDVQPRYLAGSGDDRHITHFLLAAGWTNRSDPAAPSVHLVSPDERWTLHCNGYLGGSAWWQITGRGAPGEYLSASFGRMIPVEILAGFTDALCSPPPPADRVPSVWSLLTAAGWKVSEPLDDAAWATSPDQKVRLQRELVTPEAPGHYHWSVEVGRGGGKVSWRASVTGAAPAYLMTGFTQALASPEPLRRRAWAEGPQARSGEAAVSHRKRVKAAAALLRASRRKALTANTPTRAPGSQPQAVKHR